MLCLVGVYWYVTMSRTGILLKESGRIWLVVNETRLYTVDKADASYFSPFSLPTSQIRQAGQWPNAFKYDALVLANFALKLAEDYVFS